MHEKLLISTKVVCFIVYNIDKVKIFNVLLDKFSVLTRRRYFERGARKHQLIIFRNAWTMI